jgi:hypothetical protein
VFSSGNPGPQTVCLQFTAAGMGMLGTLTVN